MKIMFPLICIAVLSLALPMLDSSAPQAWGEEVVHFMVPRLTPEQLNQLIEEKVEYVLVDTRDSSRYDYGHIDGAINIYYDPTGDPLTREIMLTALPMDKLVIFYCDCPEDKNAANMALALWDLGYDRDKVKVLVGGTLRWEMSGNSLTATKH